MRVAKVNAKTKGCAQASNAKKLASKQQLQNKNTSLFLLIPFLLMFLAPFAGNAQCSSPYTTSLMSNWTANALSQTENNISGSGVNVTVTATGETGQLVQFVGGAFNGVTGLDMRTNGFSTTGINFDVVFSQDVYDIEFQLGHVNGSAGSGGDKYTITAIDGLGNSIFPTFDDQGSTSFETNNSGVMNAIAASPIGNGTVQFSDPDGIKSIQIIWFECDMCSANFHGSVIEDFSFCSTLPVDPCTDPAGVDTDGDGVNDVCDLDNDNDGILDTTEGLDCTGGEYDWNCKTI